MSIQKPRSLDDLHLNDPVHLEMVSNGYGEYPNGYRLTDRGRETVAAAMSPARAYTDELGARCWEDENGSAYVRGTHDPDEAAVLFEDYRRGEDLPVESMTGWGEWQDAHRLWVEPTSIFSDDDGWWSLSSVSRAAVEGWVPVMKVSR